MFPQLSARSPRTPRTPCTPRNPAESRSGIAAVSFLPGIVTPREDGGAHASSSRTTTFAATLDLDSINLGELDDDDLFQLAADAKAEAELERSRQESADAAAKGEAVDISVLVKESSSEKFLNLLGLVTTMADMIILRDDLADRREAVQNKIITMEEYYSTISYGKKVGGNGKDKKLAALKADIELIEFKEDAVASQFSKMETKHASRRASLGRTLNNSFNNDADPLLSQQQERAMKAAEWFGPVLNYPLASSQVTPRIKNELVIPWLLRVASLDSDAVDRSDAMAQWMFHEFLDSFTIAELMRLTHEDLLVATAKRVLLALHPTLVTPIPPVLTTKSESIAERVVPDLTRVILLAIAAGNITDVALILSSESCNLEQALRDSEMRAIILYAIVWSGQVDTLRYLLRRGLVHSHLMLAVLFMCPNVAALQVERSVSVKTASHLAQHQLEIALGMIHSAKKSHSALPNESPASSRNVSIVMAHDDWEEDPVNVDELLDGWDTTQACVSPAGGYTNIPFETLPVAETSGAMRPQKNWALRQRVPFTQLVDSGRFKSIPQTLQALMVPYFGTDCIRKFGDRSFSSQTSAFHVAVRGDVPVIIRSCADMSDQIVDSAVERTKATGSPLRRRSPKPQHLSIDKSKSERQFYYYEAHVALDAVTSGEDAVHVGWCTDKFAADGVTPALLGNDENSFGISLIAFDTVESALHCSSVANSRASVVRGDVSALSMRARSRNEGFTSRFSINGSAVAVAVKHSNGHSQRQFPNTMHTVQISMKDYASSVNSAASSSSRLSPHQSDHSHAEVTEFCGEAVVCNYYEAFGDSSLEVENHGRAIPREEYNVEPSALEWSAVQPSGDYAPTSPTKSEKDRIRRQKSNTIIGDVVVIGCLLDISTHQATFFVNGTSLGVGFDSIPTNADLLYPCISMVKFQESNPRSPVCRFAFEHSELRFFPTLPVHPADTAASARLPQDCASAAQRQLKLFNSELKLSFMVWMMHLEEAQAATDLQPLKEIHPHSSGVSELVCDVFPVGSSLLNQRCEDRRMHFKPIAIINETVDLGAQHQDLDSASLCCVSSPTPLLFALLQRRRDVALTIASSPLVDVSITDNFGTTPLFVASALGYDEIVKVILRRGSDRALLKMFSEYSPLHTAIMGEHETTVEVILAHAKETLGEELTVLLDKPTPRGNTALHLATKMKLVDTVKRLLAAGANATILDKRQQATPLLLACSGDMPDIAEVLLQSRQYHGHPSINAPAKDNGGVALCFAAQKGMTALMPLFAEAGATPDLLLVDATPLICAIVMKFEVTAIALVDSYLSPEVKRSFYEMLQNKSRDNAEKKAALISPMKRTCSPFFCNFNVHAVDPKSQSTALHLACELNMISLVQRLLDFGALICSVNKQFATPLHLAVQNEHEELAIAILQRGKEMVQEGLSSFDISLMDARGDTVLHVACRTGMLNVIEKILAMFTVQEMLFLATRTKNPRIKPFDLLAENRMGDTPLLVAVKMGHEDVAELLISSADPATNIAAVLDSSGSSKALMATVDKGYFKLARLLLQRGAVATNDIRAFIHQKWESAMATQEQQARSLKGVIPHAPRSRPSVVASSTNNSTPNNKVINRRTSLLIVDDQHLDYPFGSEPNLKLGRKASTRAVVTEGGLQRVKSVSQLVAARLSETQKSASRSSMRRRSTVQKLFRPVGARFDDTVASALLRLFHVDELIFEFECIMGYGTLSAPQVLEHGELIVTCLLAHSKICFSASEAHVIAKAGYAYLQSRATTQSILQRKEVAKQQSALCEQVFRVIRYYAQSQENFAVEALQKIVDVYRAFTVKDHSQSPLTHQRIIINEADLTNPFSGVTALQLATSLGQAAVVRFLCKSFAIDPTYCGQKSHRETVWNGNISMLLPTRIAILHNHPETLEALLNEGRCDPNAMEPLNVWPCRDTQLHTAARVLSCDMVRMLLNYGAVPSGIPNTEGDDIWQFVVRESADILVTLLRMELSPSPEFLLKPITIAQRRRSTSAAVEDDKSLGSDDDTVSACMDNLVMSFIGGEAPEVSRNVEYFRRWYSAPFLDPDLFDHSPFGGHNMSNHQDQVNEASGDDAHESSSTRTPAQAELAIPIPPSPPQRLGLRSYFDAYFSSLMFSCVRHNPQLVLQLMKSIPLNINVTHPATDDTMLMFVISEAVITGNDIKRKSMILLATDILHNFKSDLSLGAIRADGESALSLAARCGNLDLIQLLLESGAPVLVPKKQQQAYFASSVNMSSIPRQKVVIWKLLAQLRYPFEHDGVVMYIAKFLETSPATRRAFIASVMPNLHPLGLLRLICSSPSDIVSACTNASVGLQQDATLSFWLCIMYVTCFLPDNLKGDHYLPKKLLDVALQPLTPTMPAVVHLTLHLLKVRQKCVREQQAMLQQLLNFLNAQTPMPPTISTGNNGLTSVHSGRAADRQSFARRPSSRLSVTEATPQYKQHSGRHSVTPNSVGPRMSVVGGDAIFLLRAPSESPAASSGHLQVPSVRSRRVSLVDSENPPGELQREHSNEDLPLTPASYEVEVPQIESPVGNFSHDSPTFGATPITKPLSGNSDAQEPSPLNLVNTPANLKLNITMSAIPLGIEPPRPQKGISIEILHFKAMDSWLCAVRENQTSSGSLASSPEPPATPATNSSPISGNAVSVNPIAPSPSSSDITPPLQTPLDRITDVLEICLRFGKDDAWLHYTDMIPAAVKLSTLSKERSFLSVATLCSNTSVLSSLMHARADVMFVDEIIGESGLPVGMQKSMFMAGTSTAVAMNNRDALMAAFKRQRRRLDDDNQPAGGGPRKSVAIPSNGFRFSMSGDVSSRRQGMMNLNRRMTYDPASSMKMNQPKAGLHAVEGINQIPGSINAIKAQKGLGVTLRIDGGPQRPPAPTPNFVYCLFDWAVFRHNYFGNQVPSTATNDTIMFLMNRRCPPTYPLLQFMLSRELKPKHRDTRVAFSGLTEGGWKTSGKHEVGINMLSASHQDSWLHLLVMHNQVIMADYFLTASKGLFGHSTRRNAAGLVPADYCNSYPMLMVLQQHECVDLGFAASSNQPARPCSPTPTKISSQPQVQLLVVSKGFMKLLDNDNTGIDRRMQVPVPQPRDAMLGFIDENSLSEALERQEALAFLSPRHNEQRMTSVWSTGSASPSVPHSGSAIPRPPARVSDELLLRNQRNTQQYLQDVFLPCVLYEASPTQDNFRIRRRPPDVAPALDLSVVSSGEFLNQTMNSEVLVASVTRKSVAVSDAKPLSLQLLSQPHNDYNPQPPNYAPQSPGKLGETMSLLPSPRRPGMPTNKVKTYADLVDTLQKNMYFTFVDDVSNKSHVRLSQDLSDPTKNGSRALFIAAPMLQQALKCNLIRLQNHRVAAYDQLDTAVLCSSQALQRSAQLRSLRDQLVELAGPSLTSLSLEIAPDYC